MITIQRHAPELDVFQSRRALMYHENRDYFMHGIRLLIADDSTLLRCLLVQQLGAERDFTVVGEARNGREAVDLAARLRPDIVLMDLEMPQLNGVQATERIIGQHPHIKVVLLTGHEELASLGRLAGASLSVLKSASPQELTDQIRKVYAQEKNRPEGESNEANHQSAIELLTVRHALTEMERTVLEKTIVAELTMEQIAAALSANLEKTVTVSSVKHSLQRVMTKMRVEPRTRAALVRFVLEFSKAY